MAPSNEPITSRAWLPEQVLLVCGAGAAHSQGGHGAPLLCTSAAAGRRCLSAAAAGTQPQQGRRRTAGHTVVAGDHQKSSMTCCQYDMVQMSWLRPALRGAAGAQRSHGCCFATVALGCCPSAVAAYLDVSQPRYFVASAPGRHGQGNRAMRRGLQDVQHGGCTREIFCSVCTIMTVVPLAAIV